ncbi:MAG: restriction endonuclease subunit S, partial [Arcobacteraceae bacterium]
MSNVPKLRFKEFSGEWEEKKFEDIFSFSTGKNIKQNEASPDFEIPCVRYGELYHMYGEVISKIINKTNLEPSELIFSQGNEILLPSAGEDPMDIGSASALTVPNVAIGRTINILRPLVDNIYSQKYVAYYINQMLRKKISTLAKGVSISNVYNSDLKQLNIKLPSLSEQEKIALFLSTIDTKIEQLTQKQSLLEQYKKGVMQKIFSQEIRFKADDGSEFPEWEEKKIKDIFNITRGNVLSMTLITKEKNANNIYPVYSSQTKDKGLSGFFNDFLFENCITWTTDGAGAGDVNYRKGKFYCTNVCGVLKSDKGYANQFIAELLNTVSRKYVSYVGNPKLMNNVMAEIMLLIPKSITEQTKIANFLSAIDKKIELNKTKIAQAKEFKKGLLQQMF